tara:strand:+ start:614 stop:925 length:312 start_codon:yes stop_codon:yes gene_type:complete
METTKEKHSTFTPGPWELVQERDYLNIQETKTNLIVAQFCSISEANARLIASAPEMYELLRDLSKVIENLESIGANLPYYFKDDMSMSDKVRELLAKVEGGEG